MPILIKDYSFEETVDFVYVTVDIKGVSAEKTDVYCNDLFVKINHAPFLFEADLLHEIDADNEATVVSIGDDKKQSGLIWETLLFKAPFAQIKQRRDDAVRTAQERIEKKKKEKQAKLAEHERFLVQQQIEVERRQRQELEEEKKRDQQEAQESVDEWARLTRQPQIAPSAEESHDIFDAVTDDVSAVAADEDLGFARAERDEPLDIDLDDDCEDGLDMDEIKRKVEEQLAKANGNKPAPRSAGRIEVSFTSRGPIPTSVARESEDVKWNARIEEMKKLAIKEKMETEIEDCPDAKRKALLLKDKADEFFKKGNLASSANAYTEALKNDPALTSCLSNRSAVHLQLKNYQLCIDDCDYALSIYEAEDKARKEQGMDPRHNAIKSKLLFRKGMALLLQSPQRNTKKALESYNEALVLDPKNPLIRQEVDKLMLSIQTP